MVDSQIDSFLERVIEDIDDLPLSAIQLVGALVTIYADTPKWLQTFVMVRLGKRADLTEVSPAAEALMKVAAFAAQGNSEIAHSEIHRQWKYLKTVGLEKRRASR